MSTIKNGAPTTVMLGIDDRSKRVLAIEPEQIPSHLAKVYLYAQKGPTTPQLVVGATRTNTYGDDTFDLRKQYANHQTVLSNSLNAQGNAQMIERVLPPDVGPKANMMLSLDLLPASITKYRRDSSGKVMRDSTTGLPVPETPAATVPGYIAKWVLTSVTTRTAASTDSTLFGRGAVGPGDQTAGSTQSVRYPMFEFWANSEGEVFNNSGLRMWAPIDELVNEKLLSDKKVYPFKMATITKSAPNATAKISSTLSGAPDIEFVAKEGLIDPVTDQVKSIDSIYLNEYQSILDKRFTPQYADLNGVKVYQNNINTVIGLLYDKEVNFFGQAGSDFTTTDSKPEQMYLYNFLSFTNSNGAPYHSIKINDTDANAIRLSQGTNLFAGGGSDGTMSVANYNQEVLDRVSEYANPNSDLMNSAVNVESILYDSGFPIEIKHELCKIISIRKDTGVALATFDANGPELSASEDHSIAISLRTKLQMFPESDYFGTPVTRGIIVGRSGVLRNSQYKGRLPLTIELAIKAAKFMGAGNGKWDKIELFDKAPKSIIENFDDVSATFTPVTQRVKDWDVGLNYAMDYNRSSLYWPVLKTVYDDPTSVLNSFFTMMACIEIQKVGERTHREFSGATSLTNAQLVEKVNNSVTEQTKDRFADLFTIVPKAYISSADDQRGFSWTLPIQLFANNPKTVMTLSIQAYRSSDLEVA